MIISVKEFTPPVGQEYTPTAYPGPGVYRIPQMGASSLAIVWGNMVVVGPVGSGTLVQEGGGAGGGSGLLPLDLNRLLDQIMRLVGR